MKFFSILIILLIDLWSHRLPAQTVSDARKEFRADIEAFRDVPDTSCSERDPWRARFAEQSRVFDAALKLTGAALNTDEERPANPDAALKPLVAASAEVNALWDGDSRFGYTARYANGLWLVSFRFWHRVDWHVFAREGAVKSRERWRSVLDRKPEGGYAPWETVDLQALRGGPGSSRFLVTTWRANCNGASSGVLYQAYSSSPARTSRPGCSSGTAN